MLLFSLLAGVQLLLQEPRTAVTNFPFTMVTAQLSGQYQPSFTGRIRHNILSNGAPAETWFSVFGDLENSAHTPLIVAHGGPGATHNYLLPISRLNGLFSVPVVFYDQIGNGRSTHFPEQLGNASFWTFDLFMDQLEVLVKHLGIDGNFDFLGHSFGALIGLELSSREERMKRLGMRKQILHGPAASSALQDEAIWYLREKLPVDVRHVLEKCERAGTTDSPEYLNALSVYQHETFCRLEPWPDVLYQTLEWYTKDKTVLLTLIGPSPFNVTGSMKDWSALDYLHMIKVPTLLLNGAYDSAQDSVVEPLFERIPDVKWYRFSNSSHTAHLEEPDLYLQVVWDWLANDQVPTVRST